MKIGVVSDIHGNSYALRAALAVARKEKVEKLLVLGDVVGYYYGPDEVMNLLDEWEYTFIRGNHECILKDISEGRKTELEVRQKYGSGHRVALEKLSKQHFTQITNAPDSATVEIDDCRIRMYHGSPWNPDQYLYPDSDRELLKRVATLDVDIVFVGHSHYAFTFAEGGTQLVNVGSVGQSRTQGGIANWSVLNTETKTVESKATPYRIDQLLTEISRLDPDMLYLRDVLLRNNERNV